MKTAKQILLDAADLLENNAMEIASLLTSPTKEQLHSYEVVLEASVKLREAAELA